MNIGVLLKVFVVLLGVFLLGAAVLSLAKRKLTETFCLAWSILSVMIILLGILLQPSEIERYVSIRVLILILIMGSGVIWGLWFVSKQVSILKRRNQELAMQISLLNEENEQILKEIKNIIKTQKKMEGRGEDEEENNFCN